MSSVPDGIDLEADANKPVGDLNEVLKKANLLLKKYAEMKILEDQVSELAEEIRTLESKDIPEIMDACNLKELPFNNGLKIIVEDIVKAGLPSKSSIEKEKDESKKAEKEYKLAEGLKWLRETKNDSLIKNVLALEFSKGQDNIVGDFEGQAHEMGIPTKRTESVHPASLSKLVKERMEKGEEVPKDILGVYCGKKAAVKKSG